jgi:hypothetical protein
VVSVSRLSDGVGQEGMDRRTGGLVSLRWMVNNNNNNRWVSPKQSYQPLWNSNLDISQGSVPVRGEEGISKARPTGSLK